MTRPVGSSILTQSDLAAILPHDVRTELKQFFIDDYLLDTPQTAAALRVLATVKNPFWHEHVHSSYIDWAPLLWVARHKGPEPTRLSKSQQVRIEIAASMDGVTGAHAPLLYAARVMERHHYLAVLDALRILVEGLPA